MEEQNGQVAGGAEGNAMDAIGKGAVDLKKKVAAHLDKGQGLSFLTVGQIAFVLQIFAAILTIMGFFCIGIFELISKISGPFGESSITVKGWACSFATGLLLGTLLCALAEILRMLHRIAGAVSDAPAR